MTKHFRYGPSSSKRWLSCPGSIQLSKDCAREESIYAMEGTKAHGVAEAALKQNTDAVCDDEEMRRCVQVYLDEIRQVERSHDVIFQHTERTLEHEAINGFGGTTDHFMLYWEDGKVVLHVFDYKHGAGVPVPAEENTQLLSYFAIIGSRFEGMIDFCRGTIVQPRAFAGDEIQQWECSIDRVRKHEQAVLAAQSQRHLKAGEHCRWCPAAIKCPELETHTLNIAKMDFEEVRDDRETLVRLYEVAPAVLSLLKKLPMAMTEYFRDGRGGIPGFKVIAKRLSNRQWAMDDNATLEALVAKGIPKEKIVREVLKTPPQLEKEISKPVMKELESLVTRKPTGFKVVPVTEKGESVTVDDIVASDFEKVEDYEFD